MPLLLEGRPVLSALMVLEPKATKPKAVAVVVLEPKAKLLDAGAGELKPNAEHAPKPPKLPPPPPLLPKLNQVPAD